MQTQATRQSPAEQPTVVTLILSGHLTVHQLSELLATQAGSIPQSASRVHIIYDCRTMTSYDKEARSLFVEWHKRHASKIGKIAIVTMNTLWLVVIGAMSLASGRQMRSFASVGLAERWLSTDNT